MAVYGGSNMTFEAILDTMRTQISFRAIRRVIPSSCCRRILYLTKISLSSGIG